MSRFLSIQGMDQLQELSEKLQTAPVTLTSAIAMRGRDAAEMLGNTLQSTFPRLSGKLVVDFNPQDLGYTMSITGGGGMEAIVAEVNMLSVQELQKLNDNIAIILRDSIIE